MKKDSDSERVAAPYVIDRQAAPAINANRDGSSSSDPSEVESEREEAQRRRSDSRRENVGSGDRVVGDTKRAVRLKTFFTT